MIDQRRIDGIRAKPEADRTDTERCILLYARDRGPSTFAEGVAQVAAQHGDAAGVAAGLGAVAQGCAAVQAQARGRAPGDALALWASFFNSLGMC
jgi:hypothetical protein